MDAWIGLFWPPVSKSSLLTPRTRIWTLDHGSQFVFIFTLPFIEYHPIRKTHASQFANIIERGARTGPVRVAYNTDDSEPGQSTLCRRSSESHGRETRHLPVPERMQNGLLLLPCHRSTIYYNTATRQRTPPRTRETRGT